jgi:hypothetical protein
VCASLTQAQPKSLVGCIDPRLHSAQFQRPSRIAIMAHVEHNREQAHTYNDEDPELSNRHMSIAKYAATRITTLKPPMAKSENPFKLLAMLNTQQWLFFLVAFFAW